MFNYYKLNDQEPETQAQKYNIGGYFNGWTIERNTIIEALLKKDSLIIEKIMLIISLISLLITAFSAFKV